MTVSMRRLIDAVAIHEDEFVVLCIDVAARHPLRTPLTESAGANLLLEGPILDRIKKTVGAIKAKYDDVQYAMLAKATDKAMSLFQSSGDMDPKVASVLTKIGKIGKSAMQNRALIMVLMGMVGTLVGLASNPASAQTAATQMDQSLSGHLDRLVDAVTGGTGDAAAAANSAQGAVDPRALQAVLKFNPTSIPAAGGALNLEQIAMQDQTGVIGGQQQWRRFTGAISENQGRLQSYTSQSREAMDAVARATAEIPMPDIRKYGIDPTMQDPKGYQKYTSDLGSYFHNLARMAKAVVERNDDVAQMNLQRLRGIGR